MTKRILVPVLLAPVLVVALAGCVPVWGIPTGAAPIPSGPRVTDDRDIDAVDSVVVQTDGDLTVTVGDHASLQITAPQAVMGRLTSDIVDGVLVLGVSGPQFGFGLGEISYELMVPELSEVAIEGSSDVRADFSGADDVRVTIEGSGDVTGTGIDADTVTSSIEGSGDIELSGSTDSQTLEIDGSGNFDGDELVSRAAKVSISGSGDVEVHATETLDAEISGAGEIRYRGGAAVTSDISGSGSVTAD